MKGKFFLGLILGLISGIVAGLLIAPEDGKHTMGKLKNLSKKLKEDRQANREKGHWSRYKNYGEKIS